MNTRTGSKRLAETDVTAAGPAGLELVRYYNSTVGYAPYGSSSGLLGPGWRTNYDRKIHWATEMATQYGTPVAMYRPDGTVIRFNDDGSALLPPERGHAGVLQRVGTNFEYRTEDDELETYDASGRLLSIRRSGGPLLTLTRDGNGRLTSVSDGLGRSLTFGYDGAGLLSSVTDPAGQVHQYGHDSYGNVTTVTHPDTTVRAYKYGYMSGESSGGGLRGGQNLLTGIVDENGTRYATYAYDAQERVTSSEHAGGVERVTLSYGTDANGKPQTTVTDAVGTQRVYTYTQLAAGPYANMPGRYVISSISQPCCGDSTIQGVTYDASGNVASTTDYLGRKTAYTYAAYPTNLPTVITEAAGTGQARTTQITWHSTFRKPVAVRSADHATSFNYDANGNPISKTIQSTTLAENLHQALGLYPDGGGYYFNYRGQNEKYFRGTASANGYVDGGGYWYYVMPNGDVYEFTPPYNNPQLTGAFVASLGVAYYNDPSLLWTTPAPGPSRTWTYTYNANNLLTAIDGPLSGTSDTTTLTWSASGNLLTVTNALGHVTTYGSHDAFGRPHTVTDANGVVTQVDYNSRGDVTAQTVDPGGGNPDVTSFLYDSAGELTEIFRAIGAIRPFDDVYTYDAAHRPTRVTDLFGNKLDRTLDLKDHETQATVKDSADTLRFKSEATYDSLGRLATRKNAAGTQVLSVAYDGNSNATSVVAPQNSWTLGYDARNRLTSTTNAGGNTLTRTLSVADQITQVTDARSVATSYTRSALGDLTSLTSPDRGTSTATYDGVGAVATMTDAAGRTTTVTRDLLGRATQYTLQGGGQINLTYDSGTNQKGRLTQMADSSGSTSWTYDAKGRVTAKTQVASGLTRTLSTTYDAAGRVTQMVYPSGKTIAFTYATQGSYGTTRPASITVNGANVVTGISYAANGAPAGWTFGNGQAFSRTFDLNGRMSNNGLGALTYDDAGRLTSFVGGSENYTYTYDTRDRVTLVKSGSQTKGSYVYDANGNRTSQTQPTVRTFTIDSSSNRLTAATNPAATYTYDTTGALTGDGTRTFSYDALGRLVGATNGSTTATYARNGIGERVAKTVGSTTTVFFYDDAGRLLGEYSSTGTTIQEYVYLGNTPVAIVKPVLTYYVKADELDTPREIANGSGSSVWKWKRLGFGETAPTGSQASTINIRFPGQYYDSETGTFENQHRTYDPQLGRYLQSDPIGLEGGLNTYAYVDNNPVQLIDPAGLEGYYGSQTNAGRFSVRGGEANKSVEMTLVKQGVTIRGVVGADGKVAVINNAEGPGVKAALSGTVGPASVGAEGTVQGERTEDGGFLLKAYAGIKAVFTKGNPAPTYVNHTDPKEICRVTGDQVRRAQNTWGLGNLTRGHVEGTRQYDPDVSSSE